MVSSQFMRLLSLPPTLRAIALSSTMTRTRIAACKIQQTSRHFSTTITSQSSADATATHTSVNDTEVSHFKSLASSWWDPHGSSRLLHLMNPLRHDFIKRCLRNDPDRDASQKLRYLDIGCGGGIFAESAARLRDTASVTAIDPTVEVIEVAKQHQRQDPLLLEHGRLEYINKSIEDLRVDGQGFDILTLFEVIEHIRQPSPFLKECLKHVRPGGWIIGSTIARTNTSWFTTKLMAEDVLRLVPRGTHTWDQYIQPYELRDWARSQGEMDVGAGGWQVMGVVYVPGLGWKEVEGSDAWGNYFFGMKKRASER